MKEVTIKIEGMTCSACSSRVSKALESAPGVRGVNVSLADGRAVLQSDGTSSAADLCRIVEAKGYKAHPST